VPEDVTVRHLLQHTSGLPHSDEHGLLLLARAEPGRVWTPEEVLAPTITRRPLFPPGTSWDYANSNYIVLGVMIEEVTGHPFVEVLRDRIIEPLELGSTYLAGSEDGPAPFGAYTSSWAGGPAEPIDFDYTATATQAGSAGAIVSSGPDLHTMFTAVFAEQILSTDTLTEMIMNPHQVDSPGPEPFEYDYGLGIMALTAVEEVPVEGLFGHAGHIEGYGTLVAHAPETGITAFWVVTSDDIDATPTIAPVLERILGSP
jgi:D-alanyl-D-alanine carboxypeptidase